MRFIARFLGFSIFILAAVAGLGAATMLSILYFFSSDLPDHRSLKKYSPDVSSRVFLQDGSKLCEYASEKRYFIPIDCIPTRLVHAFISVEDKHFYQHKGLDFLGIARSVVKNLKNISSGKRPQGASTITQQVARIFLIRTNEISYIRKLKEAILSFRIENALSKYQILELYLNQIYLGLGSYGVAAAAKVYFDKTVNELTIAECSYLAALAKGANNYHPVKHKEKAIERRNWAISRQLEDGYITKREANQAMQEDLVIVETEPNTKAEYFSEEIRKFLINKFSFESLSKEGLIIRCTLDTRLQKCAYESLRNGLERVDRSFGWRGPISRISINKSPSEIIRNLQEVPYPKGTDEFEKAVVVSIDSRTAKILTSTGKSGTISEQDLHWTNWNLKKGDVILVSKNDNGIFCIKQSPEVQGAIIVIETNTGRILAMQGGYSFAGSEFNRAVSAFRQSGSSFKPFVYLAALENGFAPNSIIDASPIEIDMGEKLGIWKPKNYGGTILDKVTMRQALERSVNTATIRLSQEVGIKKIAKIAEKFGIFEDMPHMLSYALGAGETTLQKLTIAYAMFANGGRRIEPTMIDYIQDKHGAAIYKADKRTANDSIGFDAEFPPKLNDNREQIISEQSIYQLTSMLNLTSDRRPELIKLFPNFSISGKTGTSNDSRDTWFIGYTPDIAVGIFVGFDDHSRSLGEKAIGYTIARPIAIEFFTKAKKFLQPKPFKVPKGIRLRKVDLETGEPPTAGSKVVITEAFKEDEDEKRDITSIDSWKKKKKASILDLLNDSSVKDDTDKSGNSKTNSVTGIY